MGKGILAGASGGGTNIPVTSDPADNVQIWIDPNEEDQNDGFYTKDETLNDATKTELGLGANATPNDAFLKLLASSTEISKYNQYWWSCLHGEAGIGYKEAKSAITSGVTIAKSNTTCTIQYSKSIEIDSATGNVTLKNPSNLVFDKFGIGSAAGYSFAQTLVNQAPVYITTTCANGVYFLPKGSNYTTFDYIGDQSYTLQAYNDSDVWVGWNLSSIANVCAEMVTTETYNIPAGETTYTYSIDRNTYPDSGVVDGITYTYLGIPFDNAVTATKIATGTYAGTGKAGSSDVNTLTFGFKPQLVIVLPGTVTSGNENYYLVLCSMLTESYKNNCIMANSGNNTVFSGSYCRLTNANQLQWYSNSGSGYQLNDSGKTYHYIAIG